MGHDLSPEALADKMSAEQRVSQFEIRDPYPIVEAVLMIAAVLAALLVAHYAEPIEIWLAGVGL